MRGVAEAGGGFDPGDRLIGTGQKVPRDCQPDSKTRLSRCQLQGFAKTPLEPPEDDFEALGKLVDGGGRRHVLN